MRRLAWCLVLFLPVGAAEVLIEDPRGDGAYHLGFPPLFEPLEAGSGATVDLLSLAVRQDGQFLVVEVEQAAPLRESMVEPYVDLVVAGHNVLLHMWTWNPFDDGHFPAYLIGKDDRVTFSGYVDEPRRVWGVKMLMHDLRKLGIEPVAGDEVVVRGAWVDSAYIVRDGETGEYNGEYDRVPDGLDADERFSLVVAEHSVGGLHLRPDLPFRSSNGAATVFVYDVVLRNDANDAAQVTFETDDLPPGWKVVAPGAIPVGAGGEVRLGVLVALPSRHVHGTEESFILRALAGSDRWAQTRLGVHFPAIPEPSGHHPLVNLMSADAEDIPPEGMDPLFGNLAFLSLSTLEVESGGEPVAALETTSGKWYWSASSERMSLGIDTDLARTGRFFGSFVSPVGMENVELSFLVTFSSSEGSGIVVEAKKQVGLLPRGERVDVEVPLVPGASGDLVPAGNDGKLWLQIELTGRKVVDPGERRGVPHLYPGASMVLPLLEYHDPVEQRFSRGDQLGLLGEATRRIVPDGTSIFAIDVRNHGPDGHPVLVQLVGAVTEPRLLGPESFQLAAGGSRTIHVALDAPSAGQADAVLLVTSQKDAGQRQALLLRAIVDPAGGDDAAEEPKLVQGDAKKSPGLAWTAVAAVAALARMRRRVL